MFVVMISFDDIPEIYGTTSRKRTHKIDKF